MQVADETVWKALADPTRRGLLDALRDGPRTTGDLCALFGQTRFGVMKHLEELTGAGLVTFERRGRERWNYLNAVVLKAALDRWLTPYQNLWADNLMSLARVFQEEQPMSTVPSLDIRQEIVLPAPPTKVFAALTRDIGRWWAMGTRQTGEGSQLSLDPVIGGTLLEINSNGHAAIWGRIEEIMAPNILYMSGRFAMKGAVAGRVHFDIGAEGENASRLVLTHQAFGLLAPETGGMFEAGWKHLLDTCLRNHLEQAATNNG